MAPNLDFERMNSSKLEVGDEAPEFDLESYKNETVSLSDLNNYDGVLVVFMCNHCPYVKMHLEDLKKIDEKFSSLAVVGINSNVETHPLDAKEKMPEFVAENEIDFYYLADPEQEVAKAFGAECTPEPFLLDYRHRVFYNGRITDREKPDEESENNYLINAIEKMLKRKNPPENQKPSIGCSIKWKEDLGDNPE